MSRLTYNILLVIVVSALVLSPLRGALAVPAAADDTSHCDQMQDGMPASEQLAGLQDPTADGPDHGCDCDGGCCDGACSACTHVSLALSDYMTLAQDGHPAHLYSIVSYGVSGRTVHPPYRPPIALQY